MHIVIAGSSGLVGTALRHSLQADGHRVTRLVRRAPSAADELQWDPDVGTLDGTGLAGADAIVNLAGAGIGDARWNEDRKRVLVESRTRTTALLAETIAGIDERPGVLLSGSAIGYYGDRGDQVLTEQSDPGDDFLADLCQQWEAATGPAESAGVRVAHLRTGMVLAPYGGALAKMLPLFKFGVGGRMGSGRAYWSWISLADEVGAIRFLLDRPVRGAVNLTAPNPVTNAEFTKTLGGALHRPTLLPVPSFGPKLLLGGELAEALLFTSARIVPAVLTDAGYSFQHPDLADAWPAILAQRDAVAAGPRPEGGHTA